MATSLISATASMPAQSELIDVVVRSKSMSTEDICILELAPSDDGFSLPPSEPGAHIEVHLGPGLVRQYSLCGLRDRSDVYTLGVLKVPESRGGSLAVHALQVGQALRISRPRNHFPLASAAPHSLLFAGGIGVTPLLSMAERLASEAASFRLHYCVRGTAQLAFMDYIASTDWSQQVSMHLDDGAPHQKLGLAAVLSEVPPDSQLYVCGPAGFMAWILAAAREQGWEESRLHKEYFAAPPAEAGGEKCFSIKIASTGAVYQVPPGNTVIQVLAQHGVNVPVSCEQGVCGTCVTAVLAGVPDHRDVFLTEGERATNAEFTPCCSRALSDQLLLDL